MPPRIERKKERKKEVVRVKIALLEVFHYVKWISWISIFRRRENNGFHGSIVDFGS